MSDNYFFQESKLLADILDVDINYIFSNNYQLTDSQKEVFKQKQTLLKQGYPLDYLLSSVKIQDLDLKLTPDTLIPRPETEEWLVNLRGRFENPLYKDYKLFDVGCGSGVIGLFLSPYFKEVISTDISKSAVEIARLNSKKNKILNTKFYHCHLLEVLIKNPYIVDENWLLIANLPYVPSERKKQAKEFKIEFEPDLALYSGGSGLDLFYQLMDQLKLLKDKHNLIPKEVYFELDPENIQLAEKRLSIYYKTEVLDDFNGFKRLLVGR